MARTSNKLIFAKRAPAFRFIGHYACLDFVNTEANKSGEIKDLLLNYEDLITWLASAKLFSRSNLTRALEEWRGKPAAERVFKQALIAAELPGQNGEKKLFTLDRFHAEPFKPLTT